MDKAASAAPYVTALNTAAIGIGYVYFYKQLQDIKTVLETLSRALNNFQTKLGGVVTADDENKVLMGQFETEIKKLNKCIKKLANVDDIDLVKADLDEVVDAIQSSGTIVKLPSARAKRSVRKDTRRKKPSKYDDSSDEESSEDEKPQKRTQFARRKKAEAPDDLVQSMRN